jgi:alkanesulfonate monooxygenase SsuD/methylene tetrahydromethanopterin reductase-like flavin-dependent oxidoreductase (luciferase family)
VHFAAIAFAVPRSVWYDQIRAGINPHLARKAAYNSRALAGEDPTSLEITADELPAIVLLKRLARGDEVSNEEAHEVTENLDSVIIGDPDTCRRKMQKYQAIGVDRLMCLMQFGRIPHEAVLRSMRLTGDCLIPGFQADASGRGERAAAVAGTAQA